MTDALVTSIYGADASRYDAMTYRRSGRSGLDLPAISLGLWQNFGGVDHAETGRAIVRRAFDRGITHFDLANNYGPPYGSAEENFGRMMAADLRPYRDELVISSKAGYDMWPGPYGNWGSRKYLVASLDQSLRRMGLDYVDVFYHHRPDPRTPLAETMGALADIVRAGKALYVGLSNYEPGQTEAGEALLRAQGVHCLVHQPRYSMLDRRIEAGLLPTLRTLGIGCAVFSPLAQGLLSSKYLDGIPEDARAARGRTLRSQQVSAEMRERLRALNDIAVARGETLARMAIAWVLRDETVTTALVGARSVEQLDDTLAALASTEFDAETLRRIDALTPPPA